MTYVKKLIIMVFLIALVGCNENDITAEKVNDIMVEEVNNQEVSALSLAENSFMHRPTCVKPNTDPVKPHYPNAPAMKCNNAADIFAELANHGAEETASLVLFDSTTEQVISLINDEKMDRRPIPTTPIPALELFDIIPASVTKLKERGSTCFYINVAGAEEKICQSNGSSPSDPQRTSDISETLEKELKKLLPTRNFNIDMLFFIDDNKMIKLLKSRNFVNVEVENSGAVTLFASGAMSYVIYQENPSCYYVNVNGDEQLFCSKI